jgi:hypothetical protein
MARQALLALSVGALVSGCVGVEDNGDVFASEGDPEATGDDGGDGGDGDDGSDGDNDGDGGDDGGDDEDDGDDDGVKFDTPGGPGDEPSGEHCDYVDILFVLDNSSSMCSYQAGLAQAFPDFVDAMFDVLPEATDLHVGLTTSSFALGGSHGESNCIPGEPLSTIESYYKRPTEETVAGNGLQGRLWEHDGRGYFAANTSSQSDRDALKQWFPAAATSVGCTDSGSAFEFDASAAAWALHEANEPTNDGFLRDEGAVLLLFILSDEADQSLEVETLTWLHDTVVAAKAGCGGDACIIGGGLLSEFCIEENENHAYEFLASFGEEPKWGDIQGGDMFNPDTSKYSEVVGDALAEVVAQTCDEIPPEG